MPGSVHVNKALKMLIRDHLHFFLTGRLLDFGDSRYNYLFVSPNFSFFNFEGQLSFLPPLFRRPCLGTVLVVGIVVAE